MRFTIKPLLVITLATLVFNCRAEPTEPVDWNTLAQRDLQFAVDTIRLKHAGSVSGQMNVTVPLETAAAVARQQTVHNQLEYRRMMTRFISAFGDPHTGIYLNTATQGWTGILIDRVGAQFRVVWSEPNWPTPLPPVNAIVQSCDGVWTGTYLESQVAPFINHAAEYSSTASDLALRSMTDQGLDWTPKQCTVVLADGTQHNVDLTLRPVDEATINARLHHFVAQATPVGVTDLSKDKHWVGMPHFNGSHGGFEAYQELYAKLAKLNQDGWVIFDLRGNGGGDSNLGNQALQALYGKEFGSKLGDTANFSKDMVVDPATIELFQKFINSPSFSGNKAYLKQILDKLQQAQQAGLRMVTVESTTRQQALALAQQVRVRPHGPRMAAIIDRNCFSSCMNFLQQVESVDDSVVLGEATIGYSPYGEISKFALPSGQGAIYIPSAVFSGFQATREPFLPGIVYPGNLADDQALMRWVATTLSGLDKH